LSRRRARTLVAGAAGLVLVLGVGLALANAGALDTSFSSDGKRIQSFNNGTDPDQAFGVAVDSQNRVVVVGSSDQTGASGIDFAIARYTTSGSLDASFSSDGKRVQSFGNGGGEDEARGVAIDSQNRIVVVGSSDQPNRDFAIARYTSSGALDTSFSGDGKRLQNFGTSTDSGFGVAIDSQDRVVVAGTSYQGTGTTIDFAIARFDTGGALDTSFSGDGKRVQSFSNGDFPDEAYGVAVDSQDRVIAGGYSSQTGGNGWDFAIARYTSSGALDTSFSGDGKRLQNFVSGALDDIARGVAVDSQNRVVVAGDSDQAGPTGNEFALARYTTSGSLDTSFAGDGKQISDFDNDVSGDFAHGVAIDSKGRIVVVGLTNQAGNNDFAIARYTTGGELDSSFSSDGRRLQSFDNGSESDFAHAVAVDSQDRVIVAGYTLQDGGADQDFAIARFLGA
jgi:uncharacterized delta-60 repeat protein